MKILAVDADHKSLEQLEGCLSSVFKEAEIVSFDNALGSFKYYTSHKEEVAQIFFPLTISPFDGFKFSELVAQPAFTGSVVFTTQTDNDEIRDLIRLNGGNRYIPKPVTTEKLKKLATLEQELCLDRYDESCSGRCSSCIYHWCEKHRSSAEI